MGEKIKDLNEIHIGSVSLMVELNKGYTKSQDDVIHVQNKHFRYLFKVKDFLHIAAEVIRSNKELSHLKEHPVIKNNDLSLNNKIDLSRDENSLEDLYISLLTDNNIDYRFIERTDKITTLIINPEDRKKLHSLCKTNKEIEILKHPYSSFFGYAYLYQMKEFELYKYQNKYYEIYYSLPCMSLTPNTWIPLDKYIQTSIWSTKGRIINQEAYYVYRLCWAIFKDNAFSENTLKVLEKNSEVLNKTEFKNYLNPVFFKFSTILIRLLKEKKYDDIVKTYLTYVEY